MLSQRMEEALSRQLNREFEAAYLYLSMSAYADALNLDGFAAWLLVQAKEELEHGHRIFRYLMDRDARIAWSGLPAPRDRFDSMLEVFETAAEHEKSLGAEIEKLATSAAEEKDNTTREFLNWFLREQVEEVALTENVRDKLRIIGGKGEGLLLLNSELARRRAE